MNSKLVLFWMLAACAVTGCAQPIVCPDWTLYDPVMAECACDVDAGLRVNFDGTACLFPDGGMVLLPGRDAAAREAGVDASAADVGVVSDLGALDVGPDVGLAMDAGAPDGGGACQGVTCDSLATCVASACVCPPGFSGTGQAPGGCRWNDPSLVSLAVSDGALQPAFAPATTAYTLSARGSTLVVTPSVAQPNRANVRVNGTLSASGSPATVALTALVTTVTVYVEAESGATREYVLRVTRRPTYLKASNTEAGDRFGTALAVSADGSTVAVGAPNEGSSGRGVGAAQNNNGAPRAGAVYVFRHGPTGWVQEAYVKASNADAQDTFGAAVSLSSDGSVLAVGAPREDSASVGVNQDPSSNASLESGAAYVFRRTGSTWSQEAYVKASNAGAGDAFGSALSLSGNGETLAVSSPGEDSNATGIGGNQNDNSAASSGAAYLFARTGGTWSQRAYIKSPDTRSEDSFGYSIGLSGQAGTLVVGARDQDNASYEDAGAAHVYRVVGSLWAFDRTLTPAVFGRQDIFGYSVAISEDGAAVVVGAIGEASAGSGPTADPLNDDSPGSGAVYVFRRFAASWAQEAYLKRSANMEPANFGSAVAIAGNGAFVYAQAPGESSNSTDIGGPEGGAQLPSSGAIYGLTPSGMSWTQSAFVKASYPVPSGGFGASIGCSTDGSVVGFGAPGDASNAVGVGGNGLDTSAPSAGAVYVY